MSTQIPAQIAVVKALTQKTAEAAMSTRRMGGWLGRLVWLIRVPGDDLVLE